MLKTIRCTVNGKARELSFDVRSSLLEVLRAEGLTSSKQGCGVGECGACTVLVDNVPCGSCIFPCRLGGRQNNPHRRGAKQGQPAFPRPTGLCGRRGPSSAASVRPASS